VIIAVDFSSSTNNKYDNNSNRLLNMNLINKYKN